MGTMYIIYKTIKGNTMKIKSFTEYMNEDSNDSQEPIEAQLANYIMVGLNMSTQAHIYHLLIAGEGSSAHHLALKAFYEGLPTAVDTLAEQSLSELTLPKTKLDFTLNFEYSEDLLNESLQAFEDETDTLLDSINEIEESSYKLSMINSVTVIQDLISALKFQLKLD
jgi:DNA-binding ferritin-like protein